MPNRRGVKTAHLLPDGVWGRGAKMGRVAAEVGTLPEQEEQPQQHLDEDQDHREGFHEEHDHRQVHHNRPPPRPRPRRRTEKDPAAFRRGFPRRVSNSAGRRANRRASYTSPGGAKSRAGAGFAYPRHPVGLPREPHQPWGLDGQGKGLDLYEVPEQRDAPQSAAEEPEGRTPPDRRRPSGGRRAPLRDALRVPRLPPRI